MSILEEIFARKREEVAYAKSQISEPDLWAIARDAAPTRGFHKALKTSKHPLALIAEVKKASPSKGTIRENFDAAEIAQAYERVGADALSVLTDVHYFQGSPENLQKARAATKLPVLRKDFIDDPYQVLQARAWGGDAILLIVAALEPNQIHDLMGFAEELDMDVLVEVHTAEETAVALDQKAKLIGVNNRNLADFKTSLGYSEALLPFITPFATGVSESALETPEDLARAQAAGARAVLIGTTFCAADDIEAKVKEVMGW